MVSDALTPGRYPVMDYSTSGWVSGMIDASTVLQGIANDETRIVPGLGPIQTLTDLKRQREMLVTVKDRVWTMIRQGKSLDEVAKEAPTREFDAALGVELPESHLRQPGPPHPPTWWCAVTTGRARESPRHRRISPVQRLIRCRFADQSASNSAVRELLR